MIDDIQYTRTFRWIWDQNGGRRQELITLETKDFDSLIEEINDLRKMLSDSNNKYHKLRRKTMRYG